MPATLDATLRSCLAYVLEMDPTGVPAGSGEPWMLSRWLGGLGMGIAAVADPERFTWAGPWIARVAAPGAEARHAVMFGVPSGVVWDPAGDGRVESEWIEAGYLIAATDIARARPPLPEAPPDVGEVVDIRVAPSAGEPTLSVATARALPGQGLEGDRHVDGRGTFPSGTPGSALTLVAAEVCESFDPPLTPDDHRRNVVTRGIDLNRLVGHEFTVGAVRCRGMRLCEPCMVLQRYAGRPVLRALVHRGGLRADILADGEIAVGDAVRAV